MQVAQVQVQVQMQVQVWGMDQHLYRARPAQQRALALEALNLLPLNQPMRLPGLYRLACA